MPNPHKSEVALVGANTTYILRYTTDAMCRLEVLHDGKPVFEIFNEYLVKVSEKNVQITELRQLAAYATEDFDCQRVNAMIDDAGVVASFAAVTQAIVRAFSNDEKSSPATKAKAGLENP